MSGNKFVMLRKSTNTVGNIENEFVNVIFVHELKNDIL